MSCATFLLLSDQPVAFVSVLVATIITMITAGVEAKGPVVNEVTTNVTFREGFLAVTNIIFAYRKSHAHNRPLQLGCHSQAPPTD